MSKSNDTPRFGRVAHHVIEHIGLAVISFDGSLDILDLNERARGMFGQPNNVGAMLAGCGEFSGQRSWAEEIQAALGRTEASLYQKVTCTVAGRRRTVQLICMPLHDQGSAAKGVLIIEDLSDKLLMEGDLAAAERLAALGKLAAQVAHELNNPLDGIIRYINLSLRVAEQEGLESLTRYLLESRKGLQRMVQILSELLDFSRSSYSAAADADLNKLVEEAVVAMEVHLLMNQVKLERVYESNMPKVRSGNLFQVFCNLIKNAADALGEQKRSQPARRLIIKTSCTAKEAVIEFIDNGPGLSHEVKSQMFEPFYTTKPASKGTGLGLAICKDIVERYGGSITGDNHTEGGCVFCVRLPLERGGQ